MCKRKNAIPLVLWLYCVLGAHARFEFSDPNQKQVQQHQFLESDSAVRLPTFFFPVNKPHEAEAVAGPAASTDDGLPKTPQNPEGGTPRQIVYSRLPSLLDAVYIFSAVCFILCLRGLSTPETAKRGNILGMVGMTAAVLVTFTEQGFGSHYLAFFLMITPAAILGLYVAQYVSMVQMPQLVALFHSFVGLAAMMVGFSNFHSPSKGDTEHLAHLVETYIGEFIAAITFSGSVVAAAKLQEIMSSQSMKLPGKHTINAIVLSGVIVLGVFFCSSVDSNTRLICLYSAVVLSLFLGFHLVASIGGADMPVVVSMLNSYSGWATAASGFMLDSTLLIISGSLIGSSGAILSYIMCRGMNRDFLNVILGGWEDVVVEGSAGIQGTVKETSADKVAEELLASKNVLIVPGYGMAVSRCQAEASDIAKVLMTRGVKVHFGIHPVAGRMPGHMNVLLAEADVPYTIVKEMEEVNPDISTVDVVLVVGANDTINPAALDPSSKIAGMPVIEVWKAKRVVVCKRSMAAGYAAIENPLFFMDNTRMLFGDAKVSMADIFARANQRAGLMKEYKSMEHIESSILPPFESLEEFIEEALPDPKKTVGVLLDNNGGSEMVALAPRFIPKLRALAFRVVVQSGAGEASRFSDEMYERAGAKVGRSAADVIEQAEIILKVSTPSDELIRNLPKGKTLVSYIWPSRNPQLLKQLAARGLTVFAVDEVPRVTRAQKLDVRSSMCNLQGYRAIIEAFSRLPRLSKASITAAGKVDSAKVFVIGAGVAGLQAISTAHGLGARVFANDTRRATKEEVESCGGKFLDISVEEEGEAADGYARDMGEAYKRAQDQLYRTIVKDCDIVICTAAIPGKPSPKLIDTSMIRSMKPGSVIVDLATEFGDRNSGWGGNCQLSPLDDVVEVDRVTIIGRSRIESHMPTQASELFSMNMVNLLEELGGGADFKVNLDDEVVRRLCVIAKGQIIWQPPQSVPSPPTPKEPHETSRPACQKPEPTFIEHIEKSDVFFAVCLFVVAAIVGIVGAVLDTLELHHLFLFILSLIVGYYCVWSVTPALHTPLMSVTNALSGVIIIGSMLELDGSVWHPWVMCALFATFLSSLNIVGGFYVTRRMLQMFTI